MSAHQQHKGASMEFDSYSKQEVLTALFAAWQPARTIEEVPVDDAVARICATELVSQFTLPVLRASSKDGIAVDSARFVSGRPDTAHFVLGQDYVRADTGDDFDDRFDAVIRIEDVTFLQGGGLALPPDLKVAPGLNVDAAGSSLAAGDFLMRPGWWIRPQDLATLVRGGITQVPVVRRPRVAFIPTGSELVPAGTTPDRGQSVDCNSTFARHVLADYGAEALIYPIVRDVDSDLEAALDTALDAADIVLINGGSSKGAEDLNASLLRRRGQRICHGAAAAPGRPLAIALIDNKPVLNIPGPMVACCYVFDWCVAAVVAQALGVGAFEHRQAQATLTADLEFPQSLEFWNRLDIKRTANGYEATPVSLHKGRGVYRIGVTSGQYINQLGEKPHQKGDKIVVDLLCDPAFL
jgi:molybdopterin molybdotransferase/putative molybdopterin biosynthesis protein